MIRSWRSLTRLLEGSLRLIAASTAISLAQSLLLVPIAFLIRHAFDVTIPDGDSTSLIWMGLAVLGLFVAGSGLGLLTRWLSLRATKEAVMRLQATLLDRLFYFPKAYFDRSDLGTLHATIVQDSLRVDMMANALVAVVVPGAVIATALIVTLFVLSPLLGGLLLVTAPVMILAGRSLGPRVRSRTRIWNEAFDAFSAQTQLALRSMTLTKLQGAERTELDRRRGQLAEVNETGRSMAWWQSFYTLLQTLISAAIGLIVLVVGGAAVADGRMSLGDLIAFYAVLGLLRTQLSGSLVAVPQVISGTESLERLDGLLDTDETEPYLGGRPIEFRGAVALRDVSFHYRAGQPVLSGLSLEIAPGEIVAVLGSNGAGKSTILNLIAGLYEPQGGTVLADGVPLDDLDVVQLRRSMGVVSQDPLIFPSSVRENINFGHPDAGAAEIAAAARRADAHDFIGRLPGGYDARVGDEGVLLSGGQRQRLALARALIGQPALLMLDEPTTHLDQSGTEALLRSLAGDAGRPAVLVVSHDAAVAASADRVLHLHEGRLVEAPGGGPWPPAEADMSGVAEYEQG